MRELRLLKKLKDPIDIAAYDRLMKMWFSILKGFWKMAEGIKRKEGGNWTDKFSDVAAARFFWPKAKNLKLCYRTTTFVYNSSGVRL